jgi:hypothetical protein
MPSPLSFAGRVQSCQEDRLARHTQSIIPHFLVKKIRAFLDIYDSDSNAKSNAKSNADSKVTETDHPAFS